METRKRRGRGHGSGCVEEDGSDEIGVVRRGRRERGGRGVSRGAESAMRETRRQIFKREREVLNGLLSDAASPAPGETGPPRAPSSPVRFVHVPGDESAIQSMHGMSGPESTLYELRVAGASQGDAGRSATTAATENQGENKNASVQAGSHDTVFVAAYQPQPD